jgi:hypothetical protein
MHPIDAQQQHMLDPIVAISIAVVLLRTEMRQGRATDQKDPGDHAARHTDSHESSRVFLCSGIYPSGVTAP